MADVSLALSKKIDVSLDLSLTWAGPGDPCDVIGWHSEQQQQQQSINAWPKDLQRQSSSRGDTAAFKNNRK